MHGQKTSNARRQTDRSSPAKFNKANLMMQQTSMLKIKCLFAVVLALPAIACMANPQPRLPVVTLNIGIHLIQAEAAIEDEERAQGLMFRKIMGQNEGMVFRFNRTDQVCMWMKNTLLPLSVAFIDEAGRIINIEDMRPETLDAHCAKKPARYALEMNQGWFKRRNIKPGNMIGGLPK